MELLNRSCPCTIKKIKGSNIYLFIRFSITALLFVSLFSYAESRSVDAVGFGVLESDENFLKARRVALENAKRNAVEQAFGSFIKARTRVNNFVFAEDVIVTNASGKISRFDIIEEGKFEEGVYRVAIRAEMEVNKLISEIQAVQTAYGMGRKPRLKINMSNTGTSQHLAGIYQSELSKKLLAEGFQLFDSRDEVAAGFSINVELSNSSQETEYQGLMLKVNAVNIVNQVTRANDNQVLASNAFSDNLNHANSNTAYSLLLKKAVAETWPDLRKQLLDFWNEEQFNDRNLYLEVEHKQSDIHPQEVLATMKRNLAGAKNIELIEKIPQKLTFLIQYRGWAEQLVDELTALQELQQLTLNVNRVQDNRIFTQLGNL